MVLTVQKRLLTLPPVVVYETEFTGRPEEKVIDRENHDVGNPPRGRQLSMSNADWLWRLIGSVNFEDRDSLRYFQRILKSSGVIEKLEESGCEDGDSVSIYDFEFDFIK